MFNFLVSYNIAAWSLIRATVCYQVGAFKVEELLVNCTNHEGKASGISFKLYALEKLLVT